MWPFKKWKKIEDLNAEQHSWSVAQAVTNHGPIIVRLNETAKKWVKHPSLNVRVGFAVPLKKPNPNGLPDPEENKAFEAIEDGLASLMAATGPSIEVLAITAGTFKEFVFYIANPTDIEKAHKQAAANFPSYDFRCYAEKDPDWVGYLRWNKR